MDDSARLEYVSKGGVHCPYCKCSILQTFDYQLMDSLAGPASLFLDVQCTECKRRWWEKYTMKMVIPIDESPVRRGATDGCRLVNASAKRRDPDPSPGDCEEIEPAPI